MPFRDTQCGFKAFRTPMARILFHLLTVERFAFDVEVLHLAQRLRMDISEIAVRWREVGSSKVRTLVDPLSMTRDVLSVSRPSRWSACQPWRWRRIPGASPLLLAVVERCAVDCGWPSRS